MVSIVNSFSPSRPMPEPVVNPKMYLVSMSFHELASCARTPPAQPNKIQHISNPSECHCPAPEGNRISKDGQKAGKVGIVPAGSLDLAPERSFFGVFLHDVQGHVAENCQIVGAVSQTASVLILVQNDVEPPAQPIFYAPRRDTNPVR